MHHALLYIVTQLTASSPGGGGILRLPGPHLHVLVRGHECTPYVQCLLVVVMSRDSVDVWHYCHQYTATLRVVIVADKTKKSLTPVAR